MPAHLPFPNVEIASNCRKDFKDQGAAVMPEMRRFCADRLRVEAKVIWVFRGLIAVCVRLEALTFVYNQLVTGRT